MSPLYHESIPNTPGIYRITCTITKKFYIGSTLNLHKRYKDHFNALQHNVHKNPKLQAAFNKYGPDAFAFEILELVLTPELLTAREQYWFSQLRPFGKRGFNILAIAGSSLGRVVPQSSREKSRATQLGRPSTRIDWHPTSEQIERSRLSRIGKKQTEEHIHNAAITRIGKKRSLTTREKMRLAALEHEVSDETRIKIATANTGHVPDIETRTNMSIAGKRRQRTPEEYASRKKTLIVTSPIGETYTITGIEAFCIEHGLNCSALIKVARGKYRHHHGWTARYAEPDAS